MSGWLADRYGPKNILLLSTILFIIPTIFQPLFAVHVGPVGNLLLRAMLGLGLVCCSLSLKYTHKRKNKLQGIGGSSVNVFIAKWFPASEKGTAVTLESAGIQIGTLLAYPLASVSCPNTDILDGWPLLFYISGIYIEHTYTHTHTHTHSGAFGILWCILFSIYATNSPLKNKLISNEEKLYLSTEVHAYHYASRKVYNK
jgi:MFS family permease